MLDTLLEKKLKNLLEKSVLVVMDDGLAFVGTLVDLDENTLILRDIYQGSSMDIDWEDISEESSAQDFKDKVEEDMKFGFINWTKIRLKEVYIQLDHVVRIWPWKPASGERATEPEGYRTPYETPVYYKKDSGIDAAKTTDNPLK